MLRRGSSSQGFKQLLASPKLSRKTEIPRKISVMGFLRLLRFPLRSRWGILSLIALICVFALTFSLLPSFPGAASEDGLPGASLDGPANVLPWGHRARPVRPNKDGRLITEEEDETEEGTMQICLVPRLSLQIDSNKFAFQPLGPLECGGTPPLFHLDKGIVRLDHTVLAGRELERCEYRGIDWMTDSYFTYTDVLTRKSQFEIKIKHDYMRIECFLKKDRKAGPNHIARRLLTKPLHPDEEQHVFSYEDIDGNHGVQLDVEKLSGGSITRALKGIPSERGSEKTGPLESMSEYINQQDIAENYYYSDDLPDFDQFLTQIIEKDEVLERKKEIKSFHKNSGLNVLIIAFDSMSHLSYQRKLPKLYKYLKDTLGAVILNAYNIVGDATTAAIVPIMTGKTETELPEVRRNKPGSTFVDIYPLIWNKFEHSGYVTMFAEDEPQLGTFNLRLNGFEQIPVDHYMRPFWQAVEESSLKADSRKHCIGPVPMHQHMLNYTKEFMLSYEGIPKFAFTFFGDLTHSDNNPAEYGDQDTVDMLEGLRAAGVLDDTLLVIMGDHGARYSQVRGTVQGKLEERLPMMSLAFPNRFRKDHPRNIEHLRTNANRLTTPFDLHETLLDVLRSVRLADPPHSKARGLSLLREIPLNRTCVSAGIPLHWCTCLHWREVPPNDPKVIKMASMVIDLINSLIHNQMDLCNHLVLKKIDDARIVMPNEKVLKFQKAFDADNRLAEFSNSTKIDTQFYQIIIETSPNNGSYEATVQHNLLEDKFLVSPDISRINVYGSQADCVMNKYPELRKFCHCKSSSKEKFREEKLKEEKLKGTKLNESVKQ